MYGPIIYYCFFVPIIIINAFCVITVTMVAFVVVTLIVIAKIITDNFHQLRQCGFINLDSVAVDT